MVVKESVFLNSNPACLPPAVCNPSILVRPASSCTFHASALSPPPLTLIKLWLLIQQMFAEMFLYALGPGGGTE